jgi:hypothetical protein
MNSKLSPQKPISKNLSVTSKSQRGRLSGKAAVTNTAVETINPIPIVTKKPFTKNDKELLEACEAGDIDQVIYLCNSFRFMLNYGTKPM